MSDFLRVSAHAIPARSSAGDKPISTASTEDAVLHLSHARRCQTLVQAGSTNARSRIASDDDGHRFDRESGRFTNKAL